MLHQLLLVQLLVNPILYLVQSCVIYILVLLSRRIYIIAVGDFESHFAGVAQRFGLL